jgi:hypothetical protein
VRTVLVPPDQQTSLRLNPVEPVILARVACLQVKPDLSTGRCRGILIVAEKLARVHITGKRSSQSRKVGVSHGEIGKRPLVGRLLGESTVFDNGPESAPDVGLPVESGSGSYGRQRYESP